MPRSTTPLLLLALAACGASDAGDDGGASSTGAAPETGTSDMSEGTGSSGQASDDTGAPTTGAPTTSGAATTDDATTADSDTTGGPVLPLDGPCELGPASPTRLAVITNDFMDPASVHVLDLATRELAVDIAPAPMDPALAWGQGKLVVIGRFGFDSLDVLDGETWAPLMSLAVKVDGVADANPQALTFAADGRAYLSLFASATVPIYDLALPAKDSQVGALDLSDFADRDGSPEPGVSFVCGGTLFVGVQRLVNFAPVDISALVAVDLASGAPIDLDAGAAGPQALPLLGPWPKQVRRDPTDPDGHTVLVLTSGLERVDLVHGTSSWAVPPETLAMVGVDGYDVQAFEVAADGASTWILATDGDFPQSAVFRVALAGEGPASKLLADLHSGGALIERAGDELWLGDPDPAQPRLRVLDLESDPPAEQDFVAAPGAPYLFLALP